MHERSMDTTSRYMTMQHASARDTLTSAPFVVSIITLLTNDFVLKQLAPGAVTGKLSDLAGLFAIAVFFSTLAPRHRAAIHIAIAALFTCWKSSAAQPLIDVWNSIAPVQIGRTVDWSDLIALVMLPLSFLYTKRPRVSSAPPIVRIAVCLVALFAFAATSVRTEEEYSSHFLFHGTPEQLEAALTRHHMQPFVTQSTGAPLGYDFRIPAPDACGEAIFASLHVEAEGEHTRIRLASLTHHCSREGNEKVWMFRIFQREVVGPLKLVPIAAV